MADIPKMRENPWGGAMTKSSFGTQLRATGLVDQDHLLRAFEIQTRAETPLGRICLEEGLVDVADSIAAAIERTATPDQLLSAIPADDLPKTQQVVLRKLIEFGDLPMKELLVETGVMLSSQMKDVVDRFGGSP